MSVFGAGFGVSPRTLHPGYPAGSFAWMADDFTTAAIPAADVVYLFPFFIFESIVVSSIFMTPTAGGAGSAVKCAVWCNNRVLARPTGLPVLGQNAGFNTTGTTQGVAAVNNVPLAPGVYWAGSKATGTLPQMVSVIRAGAMNSKLSTTSAAANAAPINGFSVPDAYANDIMALDLTGATFTPVGNNGIPMVGLGWV